MVFGTDFSLICTVPHFLSHQWEWAEWPELPVIALNIILACRIRDSISIFLGVFILLLFKCLQPGSKWNQAIIIFFKSWSRDYGDLWLHPTCSTRPSKNFILVQVTLLHSGKFSREKLLQIGEKYNFAEKIVADCSLVPHQRKPCPQILWRKLSQIATKPRNSRKFSPSKVSRYTLQVMTPSQHLEMDNPEIDSTIRLGSILSSYNGSQGTRIFFSQGKRFAV